MILPDSSKVALMGRIFELASFAILFLLLGPGPSLGQQLRIETRVYVANESEPISQNLTLFTERTIYDFLNGKQQVSIFEHTAGIFVLLDSERKVQTEITTDDLVKFTSKIHSLVKNGKGDAVIKFLADPNFEPVQFNAKKQELVLESSFVTYRARGTREDDLSLLRRVRFFHDWYARLNATRPGGSPPYARLKLNAVLEEKQILATEIHKRQTFFGSQPQTLSFRSVHKIDRELTTEDRHRMALAEADRKGCQAVTFREFRQLNSDNTQQ